MPIGAYNTAWPDIHMNPEEAVRAHRDVTDAGLLVPIHWATFRLAPHPWSGRWNGCWRGRRGRGRCGRSQPGGRVSTPASAATEREAAIERTAAEAAQNSGGGCDALPCKP
jgi:L-ascorbate metabolism protein UlaG (beta-lactamase superfamily)